MVLIIIKNIFLLPALRWALIQPAKTLNFFYNNRLSFVCLLFFIGYLEFFPECRENFLKIVLDNFKMMTYKFQVEFVNENTSTK